MSGSTHFIELLRLWLPNYTLHLESYRERVAICRTLTALSQENPEKRLTQLVISPCHYVILLWAYIIFRNNSSNGTDKKIYIL